MQDKQLLLELLNAETEDAALAALTKRKLLDDASRWRPLGGMPNNQSVVHAQQSTAPAALVEKVTNGIDAILMRRCKAAGIDPRGSAAPGGMVDAVESFFGDLSSKQASEIRGLAENSLVLYATGTKARPAISLYDAGEGQLPEDFPKTFCSLVYGSEDGSYKGAVPFVQGRFNMGGTGVLPFCGDGRKLQLIVSRAPADVAPTQHEWGFTIFCFFPSKSSPAWKYLIGPDGGILTAGSDGLGLVPKLAARSGELCAPRERVVPHGTLIKMYDYKAPRSNICGELFRKLEEYLLKPALPLRLIECREAYKANVMGVTIWDRLSAWGHDKLESGFEEGASIQIRLTTGETIPAEIRVFRASSDPNRDEAPQTGVRALINGQVHAKRDAQFFRTNAVDKEHIAGSMLVTLDCTALGQDSRNALFMSNRETFRDDPLLGELLKKLQKELNAHEGLRALNQRRYEEKIANAVSDDVGISALEDLLSTDPTLAELFGSTKPGRSGPSTIPREGPDGDDTDDDPLPFDGKDFPSYFRRADGTTSVDVELPRGGDVRVSFRTDVKNNYFSRSKHKGACTYSGGVEPTFHLFNGRMTFTFHGDKKLVDGAVVTTQIEISDNAGHGPFRLLVAAKVVPPKPKATREPPEKKTADEAPSRPDIIEVFKTPDDPPIEVERIPETTRLQLQVNKASQLLTDAKEQRPKEEEQAVEFVFKYGLALVAMGLLEAAKKTPDWAQDESACRKEIAESTAGVGRVIVPLCLTLPKKLPRAA